MTRYTSHTIYTSHTRYTRSYMYEPHHLHKPYRIHKPCHRKKGPRKTLYHTLLPIEKGSLEDTLIWCIGIPSKWKNRVTQCDKKNNSIVSVKIVS